MRDPNRERLTILNAFIHDVATGTWLGVLLLLTIFHFETKGGDWTEVLDHVEHVEGHFMTLSWVSLGVIMLTGVFRMLTWKVFGWTGDVAADRIRLLKVKHAVLGAAFTAGTAWKLLLVYAH